MRNNIYFNRASINNALIWTVSILVYPISKFFAFLKIKPNFLTFFSVIFTVLAFYFLIINQYFLFLFFWLLNIIFDFCDGQVARISKNVNKSLLRFDHLLSIFLSFFVVRETLAYLGKDLYGIWSVLFSIISWITLFDSGVGNGLRNKLVISLVNNDIECLDPR